MAVHDEDEAGEELPYLSFLLVDSRRGGRIKGKRRRRERRTGEEGRPTGTE